MQRRTPPEENIPPITLRPAPWHAPEVRKAPEEVGAPGKPSTAWLDDIKKVMCLPEDKAFIEGLLARGVTITAYDRIYFEDPYYDGTQWTTKHFEAGGTTSGTHVNMIRDADAATNASIIYHEGVHTGQPSSMPWREKEYDAYVKEDQWRIAHNLPAHDPAFRTTDASGKEVTDEAAVRAFVDREYPGVTVKSDTGEAEQVIGRTASGDTIVQRDDGTQYTRPPRAGDSFASEDEITEPPSGYPVDLSKLK